jgi:hypothetical protein
LQVTIELFYFLILHLAMQKNRKLTRTVEVVLLNGPDVNSKLLNNY